MRISTTVLPGVTQFHRDICTGLVDNRSGYGVTGCFQLEVFAKKLSEVPHAMAWGRISQERFKQKLVDMTSLAASGRLQNAMKYCTKACKTGPTSKESNSSATV